MNKHLRTITLSAILAGTSVNVSATDLVGGGSDSAALAIVGNGFTDTNPASRLSTDAGLFAGFDPAFTPYQQIGVTAGSTFAAFQAANPSHTASYCQNGSGTGKKVLLGLPGLLGEGDYHVAKDCRDYIAYPPGFSAPAGMDRPDFVFSSAPLRADDVADFIEGPNTEGDGLFQIPALGTLIALPVNLGAWTRPNFNNLQICNIFSGIAQTWDEIDSSYPAQPIHVVYRRDPSGTTFAFSQYLAAICNGNYGISSNFFKTSEKFTDAVPPIPPPTWLYSLSSEEWGTPEVVDQITAQPWSIGYSNLANVLASNLDYADVNGTDPATVTSVNYGIGDLLVNTVLGDANLYTGLPLTQIGYDIPISDPLNPDGCVNVIDPAAQLHQDYPIAAVINLVGYTQNNADPQALRALAREVVNGSSSLPTGYVRLGTASAMDQLAGTCIN